MSLFNDLSGIDELGILDPLEKSDADLLFNKSIEWIYSSNPTNPRTLWFLEPDGLEKMIPSILKSRWVPMKKEKFRAWIHTGPFQALLLRKGTTPFPDRKLYWQKPYAMFGSMKEFETYGNWVLWKWVPLREPKRALLICHHSGVLPDLRRQLFFLGIRGEFVWLADGKAPIGDSWPSELFEFNSAGALLYKNLGCSKMALDHIKMSYDMIITSHCARYPLHFIDTGLPLIHVNSTRFGNEYTCHPEKFKELQANLIVGLNSGQLRILHNNLADKWYLEKNLGVSTGPVIPSICASPLRFRIENPPVCQKPILIWDTRFHIVNSKGKIINAIRTALEGCSVATSELVEMAGKPLDDDMLEPFQAIIHIPYNISTMSCFEQGSANIPIWVPSPAYLEEILLDNEEYSELSWFCFNKHLQGDSVGLTDQVWKREVVREFIRRSDFYTNVFNNVLFFNSIEELLERVRIENYDRIIKDSYLFQTVQKLRRLRLYGTSIE